MPEHDAERPAWSRQPGEPAMAFVAFTRYRDMGHDRTLLRVAHWQHRQRGGGDANLPTQAGGGINKWAAEWQWAERVALYEDHLDTQELLRRIEQKKASDKLWLEVAQTMREAAMHTFRAYLKPNDAGEYPVMKTSDAAKLIEVASRLETDRRGDPELEFAAKLESQLIDSDGFEEYDTEEQRTEAAALAKEYIVRKAAIMKRKAV